MDVLLIDEDDEHRSWGYPDFGARRDVILSGGKYFFDLSNGTTVGSRNWCNNSVTHPRHSRKRKKGKRLTTEKDLSTGECSSLTVTIFETILQPNTIRLRQCCAHTTKLQPNSASLRQRCAHTTILQPNSLQPNPVNTRQCCAHTTQQCRRTTSFYTNNILSTSSITQHYIYTNTTQTPQIPLSSTPQQYLL